MLDVEVENKLALDSRLVVDHVVAQKITELGLER